MTRNKKTIVLGAAAAATAALVLAAGVAATGMMDDDDQPLTGEAKEQAEAAALAYTGGGTVTESEAGDNGVAYDVEVRKPDGSVVEVNLDAGFHVIGTEAEDGDEHEGSDD